MREFRVKGRENPCFAPELAENIHERNLTWAKARETGSTVDWLAFRQLIRFQIRPKPTWFNLKSPTVATLIDLTLTHTPSHYQSGLWSRPERSLCSHMYSFWFLSQMSIFDCNQRLSEEVWYPGLPPRCSSHELGENYPYYHTPLPLPVISASLSNLFKPQRFWILTNLLALAGLIQCF